MPEHSLVELQYLSAKRRK